MEGLGKSNIRASIVKVKSLLSATGLLEIPGRQGLILPHEQRRALGVI